MICRVHATLCALPLEHVVETMRPLPVEPVAGSPPFVLGLSVIRGAPVPVVDAAALLEGKESNPGRFVTVRAGSGTVALAVDAVLGVRTIPSHVLHELPPLLRDAPTAMVSAVGALDAELLFVLRSCSLVPEGALTGGATTP